MTWRRRTKAQDAAVSGVLSAARRPADPAELSGLDNALAQFRLVAGTQQPPPERARATYVPKALGATAALVVAVGGTAAAAAAGSLPDRLQQPAHDIFHAPAPPRHRPSSPSETPSVAHPSTGSSSSQAPSPTTSAPTSASSPTNPSSSSNRPSSSTPSSPTPSDDSTAISPSTASATLIVGPSSTKPGNPSPPGHGGKVKQPKKPLPTQAHGRRS